MSSPSRRAVLGHGLKVAGVLALPTGITSTVLSGVAHAGVAERSGASLRRSAFVPHVGSAFLFAAAGRLHRATLTGIGAVATGADPETSFTLHFRVAGTRLPQGGTFRVSHADLAAFDLGVNPVTADRHVYEAVILA